MNEQFILRASPGTITLVHSSTGSSSPEIGLGAAFLGAAILTVIISFVIAGTPRSPSPYPAPFLILVASAFAVAGVVFLRRGLSALQILQHGVAAEARILSVTPTGARINRQPVCDVRLLVFWPPRPPYEATARRPIHVVDMQRFAPGTQIPVRVDPERPDQVAIP